MLIKIRKFTLNRNGIFKINKVSENQCKATFHTKYKYHIEIECEDKLDKQGFIVDQLLLHNSIIAKINSLKISKSCEEFCIIISDLLELECKKAEVKISRIYTKVLALPFSNTNSAFMELETLYKEN